MRFKKVIKNTKSFVGYYPSQYKSKNGKKLSYLEIKLKQRLLWAGFDENKENEKYSKTNKNGEDAKDDDATIKNKID